MIEARKYVNSTHLLSLGAVLAGTGSRVVHPSLEWTAPAYITTQIQDPGPAPGVELFTNRISCVCSLKYTVVVRALKRLSTRPRREYL